MIEPHKAFRFCADTIERNEEGFRLIWDVPADLPYFEGHFPENPVLPGVAIIDGTLEILRIALDRGPVELGAIPSAKFLGVIKPGLKIQISLRSSDSVNWNVDWSEAASAPRPLAQLRVRLGSH